MPTQATKRQKLSVCIVTSIHPDFDVRVWRHAQSLADAGVTVHLVCPWASGIAKKNRRDDIIMHSFSRESRRLLRWRVWPRVLSQVIALRNLVDVYHFHDIDILPLMAFVSMLRPVIYDVHENYAEEMLLKEYLPIVLKRFLYISVALGQWFFSAIIKNVVVVVPYQLTTFSSSRFRTLLLPNFASKKLGENWVDDYDLRANRVLFTGSIYPENGCFFFLDVCDAIWRERQDVQFLITRRFSGPVVEKMFMRRIADLRLEGCVHILDPVPSDELWRILNTGTIGLSLQMDVKKQRIALPTKLFEFMALGIPVVASSLTYARDVIVQSDGGLLYTPGNIEECKKSIVHLVDNRNLAKTLGANGRLAFQARYNWEGLSERLLTFYSSIIAAGLSTEVI